MRGQLATAHLALSAMILLWDILLAGRIARARQAPRPFAAASALAGLLIAPALLIHLATGSALYGRPLQTIAWVWPATLALFAAQAVYATVRRLVTPVFGAPIVLYNLILLTTGVTGYALSRGADVPDLLLVLAAAHRSALGLVTGALAQWSPLVLSMPILAPAFASRWRISATARAFVAALAAVWTVLIGVEVRTGRLAVQSFGADVEADARLPERSEGELLLGVRVFPELTGAPSPAVLRQDLAVADSLGARAVAVEVDPAEVTRQSLDEIARAVDRLRRGGARLVVLLGYPGEVREFVGRRRPWRSGERVAAVERVARRLRPDYLVAAVEPYGAGARAVGRQPVERWHSYLTAAAAAAHDVDPRIRVGVALSPSTARDSALYRWATGPGSPLDVVAFTLFPGRTGARALDAAMRAADRWMAAARSTKEHWVFAGAAADVFGERNQERALWRALGWAAGRDQIAGLVIASAGDYGVATGLRAPDGHLRRAAFAAQRAARMLAEER